MKKLFTEPKAEVFFLNDENEIIYKKKFILQTTLSEALKLASGITKEESLLEDIQIKFADIAWLDIINISQDEGNLSIKYNFPKPELNHSASNPFDKIVIGKLGAEEIKDHVVRQFYNEIWKRDNEIMSVFESDDLFVEWGGPRNPYLSNGHSDLLVNYYYDGLFWLLFEYRIIQKEKIETITMESIRNNALRLSSITMEIVDAIVSKLST